MMSSYLLISAFLLGFAGSFHCMGMCGPIALSIPVPAQSTHSRWWSLLLYLLGKTVTYAALGLVFGFLGHQFVLAGLQQGLSIAMGAIMLIAVLITLLKPILFHQNKLTNWVNNQLIPLFGLLLRNPGRASSLWLGMLNGLLPCGLVYIGLTAAVATGLPHYAMLYMAVFGVGTIPVMLAFLLLTRQFSYPFRRRLRQLAPVLMTLLGTILILRGLDLGIPYISPMLDSLMLTGSRGAEAVGCHP